MRSHARIVLLPLDRKELNLCLAVLRLRKGPLQLTNEALRIALRSTRGLDGEWPKEIAFFWNKLKASNARNLKGYWSVAHDTLVKLIEQNRKKGVLVGGLPMIGVPTRIAPVAAFHPDELVRWLAFRGIANRQLGRFVKCAYCGEWGLRKRARKSNRYDTKECQEAAHLELVKQLQNAAPEFAALGRSGRDAIRAQQIANRESKLGKKGKLPAMLEYEQGIIKWRSQKNR